MSIFDDLAAEQDRLEGILLVLHNEQWLTESGASGWSVADVVLHLAQTEEGVISSVGGAELRDGFGAVAGGTVDDRADHLVRTQRTTPEVVFERWRRARREAVAALRNADPRRSLSWVATPVKPATLATTRLAEHWAHGLDVTEPLGIALPDTNRLKHIAWLAHRTLPYAFTMASEQPADVRFELTAPDGGETWTFGPDDAESVIAGPGGEFCRVAARRLDGAAAAGLTAKGPAGATALRVVRTYAV